MRIDETIRLIHTNSSYLVLLLTIFVIEPWERLPAAMETNPSHVGYFMNSLARFHFFADRQSDLVGNDFSDAGYGLQLAAARRYRGFNAAETIQNPTRSLRTDSRQSLQDEKLSFPFSFRPIAVPLHAAPGQ